MKWILLPLALFTAMQCNGQGLAYIENYAPSLCTYSGTVYPSGRLPAYTPEGRLFRFALFVAPATETVRRYTGTYESWQDMGQDLSEGWTLFGQGVNSSVAEGRIEFPKDPVAFPGYPSGTQVSLFITGWWDWGGITTWDEARWIGLGAFGSSDQVHLTLGGFPRPIPYFWGVAETQSDPMVMIEVLTEPGCAALMGLSSLVHRFTKTFTETV